MLLMIYYIINKGGAMKKGLNCEQYVKLNIKGMNYVRILKNEKFEEEGVLLISNTNKPIKIVYKYLKYLNDKGIALNTLIRISYDLCYLYDFIMFNIIDEELLDFDYLVNFVGTYLLILDKKFNPLNCIERSMQKKIPILKEYKEDNVTVLYNSKDSIKSGSIKRILENVRNYLKYLSDRSIKKIALDEIFIKKYKYVHQDGMLISVKSNLIEVYGIKAILTKAGIPNRNEKINPIDKGVIFEPDEEKEFFYILKHSGKLITYRLFFYLLSVTGMRVAECLGMKIFSYELINGNVIFKTLDCDLKIANDKENTWELNIVVRPDSPSDLKIKFRKERTIIFTDNSREFRNLFEQYVRYRKYLINRKKKSNMQYLFINRDGNRLKYGATEKMFTSIIEKIFPASECSEEINIENRERKEMLKIHSFRHTYASKWIKVAEVLHKDVELYLLADLLGHADPKTTKATYIHLFQTDKKILLSKLEETKYINIEE